MSRSNLAAKADTFYTAEEYLVFEREASEKHEFFNGEIVAMAGASEKHNIISSNIYTEISICLKDTNCRPFASDMRVEAVKSRKHNYFYPDIVVTCGERKYTDENRDTLTNPTVIIEILSKSTQLKDRNEKFESYLAVESLRDYILVEQDIMRIEHYSRLDKNSWAVRLFSDFEEEINLASINCRLRLDEIYKEVESE